VATHARKEKFNAKTDTIAHYDERKNLHRSDQELVPKRHHQRVGNAYFANGEQVLVALVPSAE
jgi:hypothetical protein